MSHQERDNVRAAYLHKAKFLEERRAMMQWWADYLDACRTQFIAPYEFSGKHKNRDEADSGAIQLLNDYANICQKEPIKPEEFLAHYVNV